jgi:hypothetical protein
VDDGATITLNGGRFLFLDENAATTTTSEDVPNLLLVRCAGLKYDQVFACGSGSDLQFTADGGSVHDLKNGDGNTLFDLVDTERSGIGLRFFDGIGLALCHSDASPELVSDASSRDAYSYSATNSNEIMGSEGDWEDGILVGNDNEFLLGDGDSTQSCASGELASIVVSSVNLFRNAISPRLTDVKGNGNDPFILGLAGRTHRGQVNDFAYDSDLYGLAGGLDHLFKLNNGGYWRAGAAIGYIRGDAVFSGKGSGKEKSAEQGLYSLALFAAYENFDAKKLKLDISLCAGLGYGNNKLFRVDNDGNAFDGKMESHNEFISLEGIKNLIACNDVQVSVCGCGRITTISGRRATTRRSPPLPPIAADTYPTPPLIS